MKHKINVPEGCKVMTVEVINDRIVLQVEKEEKNKLNDDFMFKENEILFCRNSETAWIAIFNKCKDKCSFYAKVVYVVGTEDLAENEWCFYGKMVRLATDSEKQLLFDKLKEKCLMFDGENIVRWRSNVRCDFYYLSGDSMVMNAVECGHNWQDNAYKSGNYFPTRELAEAFQKVYIESLNNFHKNL